MTHAALVFGYHFKHYRFAKKLTVLEIVQDKRGKLIHHENFLYKIKKKTTQKKYLECNRRCGTRMIVDSNITNILSLPTIHSHLEEFLYDLTI